MLNLQEFAKLLHNLIESYIENYTELSKGGINNTVH